MTDSKLFQISILLFLFICAHVLSRTLLQCPEGQRPWIPCVDSRVDVSHLMWMLGTKLRSSGKAISSLNHKEVKPSQHLLGQGGVEERIKCHLAKNILQIIKYYMCVLYIHI